MDRPFPAYSGNEPYVFVSYSHRNSSAVYPELVWLKESGFNIWYDEGIEAGTEWRDEIGKAIKNASLFLYFVSPESAQSENCRKEVSFADKEHIPIVAIYLKSTALPEGLDLTLSDRQAILKYEIPKQEYQQKLQSRISSYLDQPIIQPVVVKRKKTVPIVATVAGVAVVVIGLVFFDQQGVQQTTEATTEDQVDVGAMYSIAVLPFANMSSNDATGFFATGLSEEILDNLAQAEWLRVVSRSASFQFTGLGVDPSKVGSELNVSYLLEGSVRQADDKLRITAQLIRTEDGFHVWSKSYEGMRDGFELQTAVGASIARFAETMLENDVFKNHAWKQKSWTADIDPIAIKHYMTAGDINRQENGDFETAVQFLRNAVEVDPKFYAAYIDLTHGYIVSHRLGKLSLQEARPAAHAAIANALEIVPDFPDSLHLLALVHLFLDLNYASADAVMRRELVLDPEYGLSHIRLANIAVREGRTSDALKRIASASEKIRESTRVSFLRNVAGDYKGSLKASIKRARLFLEGQDRAAHLRLHATSLVMLGRTEEAKPLIEEGWQLDGVTNPEHYIALFAYIGEITKSKNILSDSRFDLTNHYYLAEGYLALEDTDNTFKSILAGIEEHNQHLIESLIVAKWWDPIRDDPRFDEMLKLLDSKVTHTDQHQRDHDSSMENQ